MSLTLKGTRTDMLCSALFLRCVSVLRVGTRAPPIDILLFAHPIIARFLPARKKDQNSSRGDALPQLGRLRDVAAGERLGDILSGVEAGRLLGGIGLHGSLLVHGELAAWQRCNSC
eukprot:258820-Rhodomonas_salina.4